jgi:NAD(P)-dependent dehydrogenase (short-subunit alcohol dehydrogenase family)
MDVMARIFITGSTEGLGRAAARRLIDEGHDVVVHARSPERAWALADLASRAAGVVVGDLRSAAVSKDPSAMVTGRYWHQLRQQQPASEVMDAAFQDQLIAELGGLTGVALPERTLV